MSHVPHPKAVAGVAVGLLVIAGCASQSTDATQATPTAFPKEPACTEKAVLAALPDGDTMQMMTCAPLVSGYWAAATVTPGPKTYFLKADGASWKQTESPCGQNLPDMTDQIMDYCKS